MNDIVDQKTRANYSYKPNPLAVTLIPTTSSENHQLVVPDEPDAVPAEQTPNAAPPSAPESAAVESAEPPASSPTA